MVTSMHIYWYTLAEHRRPDRLALATLRPGDRMTFHCLATKDGHPTAGSPAPYDVVRELPEARRLREGSAEWLLSRTLVYPQRALLRDRLVRRLRVELCHVQFLNYFVDAWALRRLARRTTLVSTVHDVVPHQRRVPPAVERRLLSRLYRSCGTIVVAHRYLRERLASDFAMDPERIEVIPLPVPPVTPEPVAGAASPGRRLLFFGTLRRNKGVDVLLDAIKLLAHDDEMRVHFAGRGAAEVEAQVATAAGQDGRITFENGYASLRRKDELFRSAALIVLPYTSFSSQSGVLSDAYSYRVPVVVSDVGALGLTVEDDRSGWVVPPEDSEALAATIAAALDDPGGMAQRARAIDDAARHRTHEAVGRLHRDLYDRLVG